MKLYNKTTRKIRLSSSGITLPASSVEGERGEAIELDRKQIADIAADYKTLLDLTKKGSIESEQ